MLPDPKDRKAEADTATDAKTRPGAQDPHAQDPHAQDDVTIAREDEIKDAPAGKKQLDEGLEDSMDGSDPPSALQP